MDKNNIKYYFIRTKDEKVADSLGDCGFYLVNKENGFFVFLNDSKLNFTSDIDMSKLQYTNVMFI